MRQVRVPASVSALMPSACPPGPFCPDNPLISKAKMSGSNSCDGIVLSRFKSAFVRFLCSWGIRFHVSPCQIRLVVDMSPGLRSGAVVGIVPAGFVPAYAGDQDAEGPVFLDAWISYEQIDAADDPVQAAV